MSAQPQPGVTLEEYLAIEREAEFRSEYYDGTMYAVPDGSYSQGKIISNLRQAFKGKSCTILPSDFRVQVTPQTYAYPDVVVVCGDPKFIDKRNDTLLNPTLLIEVLSPSTGEQHRPFRSKYYRRIESLQEYALVSQTEEHIEIYRRLPDGDWLLHEPRGHWSTCSFESLGCAPSLYEIYDQVTFEQ